MILQSRIFARRHSLVREHIPDHGGNVCYRRGVVCIFDPGV